MQTGVGPGTEARNEASTGGRIRRAIAVLVVGAVAATGWTWLGEPAVGSAPVGTRIGVTAPAQAGKCLMPRTGEQAVGLTVEQRVVTICPGAAKRKARQFRKHRLGNAKGIRIPKAMQRRIKKKWRRMHGRAADGCCDWITDPLKATACLVTDPVGAHRGVCDEGQRSVNRIMDKTREITIICGGAAVVGAGRNGGNAWAAGWGGGLCLWGYYFDLIG